MFKFLHFFQKAFTLRMLGDFLAILIFLTFSLSFLSGIMWTTKLRPKALQNELIFVDRQKVLVFGIWQQVENLENRSEQLLNQKPCSDERKNEKLDLDYKKQKIENTQNLINQYRLQGDKIQEETRNTNYSIEIQNLVKELVSSNQDYLHDLYVWQEEKLKNMDLINNWQQKVNLFCVSQLEEQKSQIKELETLLVKIDNLKNFQNWQQNNQQWLTYAKRSVEENWNEKKKEPNISPNLSKDLENFKIKTNEIFKLEFDSDNFSQKFQARIESVENWEKERLRNLSRFDNLPKLKNTLIFFGEKKAISQT